MSVYEQSIHELDEADFAARVVERSRELPVVVDFWAEWCGPCRQLTPVLERAVSARAGKVELAKVDVDRNQALAARFGVQGIPAVKAFRDGRVVDEFTGALPPAQVERFFDSLVPSEADELAAAGDEDSLRRALAIDPRHADARIGLARLLLARGEAAEALAHAREAAAVSFLADGLAARAELALGGAASADAVPAPASDDAAASAVAATLRRAFSAWDDGDHATALERLQEAFAAEADPERRDLVRRVMVGIFTELGPDAELAREHRRRLSTALY